MTKTMWVCLISRCPGYGWLQAFVQEMRFRQWEKQGCPEPPPHKVKQQVLRKLASKYGLTMLVETGTLFGDMIYAMRRDFSFIYSIELSESLWRQATRRFRTFSHVELLNGDSGKVLHDLVPELRKPVLFWLDGHYSGEGTARGEEETPIFRELDAVLELSTPFVIAIDDARLFGTDPAYPILQVLIDYVHSKNGSLHVCVDNDVIAITPNEKCVDEGGLE